MSMQTSLPGGIPEASGASQARLMIMEMQLENFKSYAGVQQIGPFHKFFTSIVGPNGSGKSNVIDALLFVFGFKASRIRLKKISELVHTSAKHPNITQARVTVVFADILDHPGSDDYEEVPGSRFSISRTADVDNSSKYYIGDKKSSFTEVTELLRGKGIDLDHNRFLILQGEVEAISLMPPKARNEHETGMLEYLEDIIGTGRYKEQIEACAREAGELTEQRDGALHLVRASVKDRDALNTARLEAEQFLRMEADYFRAQSISYQLSVGSLEGRRAQCASRLAEFKKTYET
eukprot:RCo007940